LRAEDDKDINPRSRSLGESYRKQQNGNQQIRVGTSIYTPMQPKAKADGEDDIIDTQSLKANKVQTSGANAETNNGNEDDDDDDDDDDEPRER